MNKLIVLVRRAACCLLLVWAGAAPARVAPVALPADALQQAAGKALSAALAPATLRVVVQADGAPAALMVPAGALVLRPRVAELARQLAPRMLVWVDVLVDDHLVRAVPVALRVSAFRRVWTARADLPAGAVLAAPMLTLAEADIAAAPDALDRPDLLAGGGARLRHALLAGQPLRAAMLEALPAVARGDIVSLRLSAGAVRVETRVLALQDGRLGQRVQVRAANDQPAMAALVTGPGQVGIVEP